MKRESLSVMETLAAFDPVGFSFLCEHTTRLRAIARRDPDPLRKEALGEDVAAVAATIGAETPLDGYECDLLGVGEAYGYVMSRG